MKLIRPVAVAESGSFSRASTATYYGSDGLIKTAAIDEPRLNYNPENLSGGPSFLIEPAGTNLLTYSEQFDNAAWNKQGSNVTATNVLSPDGAYTAEYVDNNADTTSLFNKGVTVIASSANNYYASIFVKRGSNSTFTFNCYYDGNAEDNVHFNFDTLAVLAVPYAGEYIFQSVGNGWYRCGFRVTKDSTGLKTSIWFRIWESGRTITTGGLNVWGAQLELGSVATSYIPTTTAAVTRSADINTTSLISNAPETDHAAWNSSTSYSAGTRVILVSTHKIYECLVLNTNFNPSTNLTGVTPKWIEISSTNKWKMFDAGWGSQTTIATPLTFTLTPPAIVNSLALLNVAATSITVNMTSSGVNVYSNTSVMFGAEEIIDWYSYFFEAITYKSDLVLTDLPPYSNGIITVSIINTGSTAKCGNCVIGSFYDIGDTQYGASAGIVDYSVKTTDTFGNTTVVKRNYAKRMNSNLMINNAIVDDVVNLLGSYRSTPLVWVGAENNYTSLIVYGFYKDFDVNIAYPDYSSCSLTIEGLT